MKKASIGLNSTALRLLAMILMLIDHVGAVLFPEAVWMRIVGRLAFPIFAFQTAQGYRHTRDFKGYCLRLVLFGLVSEIPFHLMISGHPLYPFHQNVMFTLLLGLLVLWQLDGLQADQTVGKRLARLEKLALLMLVGVFLFADYGLLGVMTVVVFHLFREKKPAQLIALAAIHVFGYDSADLSLFGGAVQFPIQSFAVLALIPIWLYNGEKGPGGKGFQYAAYAFYPAHMLLLALTQIL